MLSCLVREGRFDDDGDDGRISPSSDPWGWVCGGLESDEGSLVDGESQRSTTSDFNYYVIRTGGFVEGGRGYGCCRGIAIRLGIDSLVSLSFGSSKWEANGHRSWGCSSSFS